MHQIVVAAGLDELDAALGWVAGGGLADPGRPPMAMMTRNWTAGTPSQTGSRRPDETTAAVVYLASAEAE